MISMRRQLLQWLMLGIAVSSAFSGASVYRYTRREVDELYNAHLQQVAIMLAQQLNDVDDQKLRSSIIPSIRKIEHWEEEVYLIQVWGKDGHLREATSAEVGALSKTIPLQPHAGLFRTILAGESWRIYRADGEYLTVQLAQPESARAGVIRETSRRIIVPLLLQIPLLVFVIWVAVRRGLRPLDQLSHAIGQRHPSALTPLSVERLPLDLQPLVHTLNALLVRLDAALQQQRNFVADAAHELRTPLAALQLQLDLLKRAKTAQDRELSLSLLGKGIRRATYLIEQLLRIARAEATQAGEPPAAVSLQPFAGEAVERHLEAARVRDIDLGVTRLEPVAIRCAAADIETVLDNLLSNAIRYTPRGGKVDLAVYPEGDCAVIDTIDTGIGIPAAERVRIFDRFHRLLTVQEIGDFVEGSGLGLAIVRSLCERYGATIEVDDGPSNVGTRFRVRWPLAAV
jgi:two-component system OmpR family sensor kinase